MLALLFAGRILYCISKEILWQNSNSNNHLGYMNAT